MCTRRPLGNGAMKKILLLICLLLTTPANAITVNATFSDGGTLTGCFNVDGNGAPISGSLHADTILSITPNPPGGTFHALVSFGVTSSDPGNGPGVLTEKGGTNFGPLATLLLNFDSGGILSGLI